MNLIPAKFLIATTTTTAFMAGVAGALIVFGDRISRGQPIDGSIWKPIGMFVIGGFFSGIYLVRSMIYMSNPALKYQSLLGVSHDEGRGRKEIVLRLMIEDPEGKVRGDTIVLPRDITLDQMKEAAIAIVRSDYSFTSGLSGSSAPFSRQQLEWLRDTLVAKNMARWNNPRSHNQGVTLEQVGKALFRKLSELEDETPPPSLLRTLKDE